MVTLIRRPKKPLPCLRRRPSSRAAERLENQLDEHWIAARRAGSKERLWASLCRDSQSEDGLAARWPRTGDRAPEPSYEFVGPLCRWADGRLCLGAFFRRRS